MKTGFVLVAGGLGERLGYNNIKVRLPVETYTMLSYLGYYIQKILAIQVKFVFVFDPEPHPFKRSSLDSSRDYDILKQSLPVCVNTTPHV